MLADLTARTPTSIVGSACSPQRALPRCAARAQAHRSPQPPSAYGRRAAFSLAGPCVWRAICPTSCCRNRSRRNSFPTTGSSCKSGAGYAEAESMLTKWALPNHECRASLELASVAWTDGAPADRYNRQIGCRTSHARPRPGACLGLNFKQAGVPVRVELHS
jgi:hypothetical protein